MKNNRKVQSFISIVLITMLILFPIIPTNAAKLLKLRPYRKPPSSVALTFNPVKREKKVEKEEKRTEFSKTFQNPDGTFSLQYFPYAIHIKDKKGKWIDKPTSQDSGTLLSSVFNQTSPIPLSMCLYSSGSSFTEAGSQNSNHMTLYRYTTGGNQYRSDCYIRFPSLQDLIPSDGILTSATLITTFEDSNAQAFDVGAYPIMQAWNPQTVTSTSLPNVSSTSSGSATWNLLPNSSRASRSIDISSLASLWFDGTQSDFGVCLSLSDETQQQIGVVNADLPVLLVKYSVSVQPANPSLGGSYYSDSMTPPVLIPGRMLMINRTGDMDNEIKSFSVIKFPKEEILPYCIEPIGGELLLSTPITLPGNSSIPMNMPQLHSNTFFSSYNFPPLNGDIYTNNATTVDLPTNDPAPVNLTFTPPGPTCYPFLNLSNNSNYRHSFIDISSYFTTPVSSLAYPNYSQDYLIAVLETDSSRVSSTNEIQAPLSTLPSVNVIISKNERRDGVKQLQSDKSIIGGLIGGSIFPPPFGPGGGTGTNPKDGSDWITLPIVCGSVMGCMQLSASATYNTPEAFNYLANDPIGRYGIGWSGSGDERIILPGNPSHPGDESILYHDTNGSVTHFAAIYDEYGQKDNEYTPPSNADWKIIYDPNAPPSERYKLISKTGDIIYCFDQVDGYLRKILSAQGASIEFQRNSIDTSILENMVDMHSNRKIHFSYNNNGQVNQITYLVYNNPVLSGEYVYGPGGHLIKVSIGDHYIDLTYNQKNLPTQISFDNSPILNYTYSTSENSYAVSTITDACSNVTTLSIDKDLQKSTILDSMNRETSFEYYDEGNLKTVNDPNEGSMYFEPDSEHASTDTSKITTCGQVVNPISQDFVYDENRNNTIIVDATNEQSTVEYNSQNKAISATNRDGLTEEFTYTSDGSQIETVTGPDGQVTTYSYDTNKQLESVESTFKTGTTVVTSYTHDAFGYIDTITDPLNRVTDLDYDAFGRLIKSTDPVGQETSIEYDEDGLMTSILVENEDGIKDINLVYDSMGNLSTVIDPAGNETQYEYDLCGKIVGYIDALNRETTFVHDSLGRLTSVTDAKNHTTTATYDVLGRLTSVTDPLQKVTTYQYDSRSRLYRVTDPLNHTTQLTYDDLNRITTIQDPANGTNSFTWSNEGKLTSLTNSKNNTWELSYNNGGQLSNIQGPLNSEVSYEYFPFGGIKKIINSNNQYVQYDYDSALRLTSIKDIQNRETSITYDNANRITDLTDSGSRENHFTYDAFGNLVEKEDALGNIVQMEYDISNNCTALITPTNDRYEFTYDALDRVIQTKDPLNHIRYKTYDEVGNQTSFEDPLGHITEWLFDTRNQLQKSTDPLDQETNFTHDDKGRLSTLTDPLSNVTQFQYDSLDRLTQITTPLSNATQYLYDANSNLTRRTRPATTQTNAYQANYAYDSLDRLTTYTSPLGRETTFSYNDLSQITDVSLPENKSLSYDYDSYNRLSSITNSSNRSLSYDYDSLDRVTEITDSVTGSYQYSFDDLDRIIEETDPSSLVTSYTFDASSRLTRKTWNSNQTDYSYDAASRLTQIDAPGSRTYDLSYDVADRIINEDLPSGVSVGFLYDANDRITSQIYSLPGGSSDQYISSSSNSTRTASRNNRSPLSSFTLSSFSLLMLSWMLKQSSWQSEYDQAGKMTEALWQKKVALNNEWKKSLLTPITISSFEPTYDANSRITEEDINLNSTTHTRQYTYDDEDQLLTASIPGKSYTWTYDTRNNRLTQRIVTSSTDTTESYTYNIEDQLTARVKRNTSDQSLIESESYSYNQIGEMTSRTLTIGQNTYTTAYEYFVGGNLKQVTLPDSSVVSFDYDAQGNRCKKTTATEIITYSYAGGSMEQEVHEDQNQTVLYTLRYYPWGFTKTVNQTTTAYYYILDPKGFVWGITDSTGTILETYSYSPFGELLSTPTITQSRFVSGGDECTWDGDIKLNYQHARYYDPSIGRFIQEDAVEGSLSSPISQNRYIYCQNDPISLADPSGNTPENTGTPPRSNQDNMGSILNNNIACNMPDITLADNKAMNMMDLYINDPVNHMMVLKSSYLPTSPYVPEGSAYDSCGSWESLYGKQNVVVQYNTKTGEYRYKVTILGHEIYVQEIGGYWHAYSLDYTDDGLYIAWGIDEGFYDIQNRGGSFASIIVLLNDIANFATENYGTWTKIYTGPEMMSTFFKHATVGAAIKQAIRDDDSYYNDKGQYNMSIGFWTSYFVTEQEKNGWKIEWNSTINYNSDGTINENTSYFGIVDMARIARAIMWKENQSGAFNEKSANKNTSDGSYDYGLMQVNNKTFIDGEDKTKPKSGVLYTSRLFTNLSGYKNDSSLWQSNPFGNIGAGIGEMFCKTYNEYAKSCYGSPVPSVWHWLTNLEGKGFVHQYNPRSSTDVPLVRSMLTRMTNGKYKFKKGLW